MRLGQKREGLDENWSPVVNFQLSPVTLAQKKTWYEKDIKWKEIEAFSSKNIRSTLDQIGLGELWIKGHYMDIEMVDTMRLIEQQNWMSEMNNDIRRDAVRKYKTINN